ncbi:MAG: general secretion pathway protein GspG [Gammaproteobacteria bacterium RIFCSPLOWO2_02_FULL_61_13]|nr:MAG: general secretion pathway protein GspG [Gammaproteobacteria bacterium RIFCSPLOWO2_02_FULL_61_13]
MRTPAIRGFTMLEMVVTLAVLGVLAAIAVPVAELAYKRTKEQDLRYNLRQIREGIDAYKRAADEGRVVKKVGESGYPPRLELLSDGVEDLRSPSKAKIYFLRRIPPDPMALPGLAGAESWGKRSYASAPEEPKAGDDVYDIYSLNPGIGINGIPYREW